MAFPLWLVCIPQPTPLGSVCRHESGSAHNFRVARPTTTGGDC